MDNCVKLWANELQCADLDNEEDNMEIGGEK